MWSRLPLPAAKSLALGWAALVIIVLAMAWRQGPAFDSSILTLLPQSEQDPLAYRAGVQLNRLLVFTSSERFISTCL